MTSTVETTGQLATRIQEMSGKTITGTCVSMGTEHTGPVVRVAVHSRYADGTPASTATPSRSNSLGRDVILVPVS